MRPPRSYSPISGWFFVALLGVVLAGLLLLERSRPPRRVPPPVFITELQVHNSRLADEDLERSDWIELHNAGDAPVDLDGWFLTDNYRHANRWRFPSVVIEARGYLIVFASGKDRHEAGRELHTNFKLNDQGEYLALLRPDGQSIAQDFLPKYPPLQQNVSFGIAPSFFDGPISGSPSRQYSYFLTPTPGQRNSNPAAGFVKAVDFSRDSGFFDGPFLVTLDCRTPGASIYYTTNFNSAGPAAGILYKGPLRITANTSIRAVAVRKDFASSVETSRSFLFPSQILVQTGAGFPDSWGVDQGRPVVADYGMDPEVLTNSAYAPEAVAALKKLPVLSITASVADLFGKERGIYSHPQSTGEDWERESVVELIFPGGRKGFTMHAGLRIQGGWNRRPEESPKHSFRILFKKEYGSGKLKFPLFDPKKTEEFDTLVLRGGNNNSWLHWSGEERLRGDYLRDQWMRESFGEMGQVSSRGMFAHLYLDGLYWGIYNLAERPSAPFMASRIGGRPRDYETRNADKVLEGDGAAWNELMAGVNQPPRTKEEWRRLCGMADMTNVVDYLVLNYFGANGDWDRSSNWYAGRRRNPPGPFQFFLWDGERNLEHVEDNTMDFDDDQSPPRFFHKLKEIPEFRRLFADRLNRHFSTNGALSPARSIARFQRLAALIEVPIIAESARWGDYRRDVHPYKTPPYLLYTRDEHWRPEVRRILSEYFPKRSATFLEMCRKAGLYPSVGANAGPQGDTAP